MKYFVRAVKYFFYFAFITTAIILALVLIGAVEGDINAIFDGGYSSLWKIAAFFALVAAVYPKVGFIRRDIPSGRSWDEIKAEATEYLRERRYILESKSDDSIAFRCRSTASRLVKMNEDRIIITYSPEGCEMEGLRKDVLRLATGLEHRLNPHIED